MRKIFRLSNAVIVFDRRLEVEKARSIMLKTILMMFNREILRKLKLLANKQ